MGTNPAINRPAAADWAAGPEHVVVVGYGPVAAHFVDQLLPAVKTGRLSVLVVGEEELPAYNRMLLADLGVGRISAEGMVISDPQELLDDGVEVLLGTRVSSIDRARRQVSLADGTSRPYDKLVLATGARAWVPNLQGLDCGPDGLHLLPPGVTALRDQNDAAELRTVVETGGHVVILGGGILGIEAALAAADEGATVTVVYNSPEPLARNLDVGGGTILAASLRARGIRLISDAFATGVELRAQADGQYRFRALVLAGGTEISGDLLVLSCGIRPRTELASGADLPAGRGIRVNHRLEADTERRIFAIGDCAEVLCQEAGCIECNSREGAGPSGLIGPGWRQAEWLAEQLGAGAEPHVAPSADGGNGGRLEAEKPAVILLKARGLDLAAAGVVDAEPWDCGPAGQDSRKVALWADPEHGCYVKMVTRAGVLEGLISIGMPRTSAELALLFERGTELPGDRTVLFHLDALNPPGPPTAPPGRGSTLCRCTGTTVGAVEDAIAGGCATVVEVARSTRAGSGCRGCRERIMDLIAASFRHTQTM